MEEKKTNVALEEMLEPLGSFGRYQCVQFLLHILSAMTAAMHMLALVTVAAVPDHRCAIPNVDTNTSTALWNSTEVLLAIPINPAGGLDSCYILSEGNNSVKCDSWVFDSTYRTSSRAIEWSFVCDQRWMGAVAQCIYMLGVFTGSITLGNLADKYGRKIIFCWCGVLQLVFGVAVAFVPEYWSFVITCFFYGIVGSAGSYLAGFVLTMEIVGASRRTVCGIAFQAAFAFGIMLVAGWGAVIDDRVVLQVIYGLHSLLLIPHFWVMDESPRWLWSQGRMREAVTIVNKAYKMNGLKSTLDPNEYAARGKTAAALQEASGSIFDLFKTPNMRSKTLNICLCWFANSLVYFGLSLSSGQLNGNPYLMLFFVGLVEIPSYAAAIFFLDLIGRRPVISSLMLAGGTCCVIATFLPKSSVETTSIIMLGKCFIAGSFAIVYIYSAELSPTVVRNSALGLGAMCARLSGALTPLIALLDFLNPKIPAIIFGVIALTSGFLAMFLPETMGHPMPETMKEGEEFGKGDTCFTMCIDKSRSRAESLEDIPEVTVPLNQEDK